MIILASSSNYRKELLSRLNLDFKTLSPDIDEESFKLSSLTFEQVAETLSLEKAKEVLKNNPNSSVIGSDQVLGFEGQIFDKPMTEQKAKEQLKLLQGSTHKLITSFTILSKDKTLTETVTAHMEMKSLTDQQIENYISKDQPLYSCGSYKLESLGIALFESIKCEDDTAIVGLPLLKLVKALKEFGIEVI